MSKQDRSSRFTEDHPYFHLKQARPSLRKSYIQQGKIIDPDAPQVLENAIDMIGECEEMCPEYERYEREYQKKLDPLELDPANPTVSDPARVVKRFARSSAGDEASLPCDVRPPRVLVVRILLKTYRKHWIISLRSYIDTAWKSLIHLFETEQEQSEMILRFKTIGASKRSTATSGSHVSILSAAMNCVKCLR